MWGKRDSNAVRERGNLLVGFAITYILRKTAARSQTHTKAQKVMALKTRF